MILGRLTRPGLCVFFILLLLLPSLLFSHEIHLKNGKIIKTKALKKNKNSIQYELYGGTITIKRSEIEKIVYSQKKIARQKFPAKNQRPSDDQDLAASLKNKLKPKTPVENANLATLSIKTHAGSGSGFFINDQGFIITNRHVVRGSEKQEEDVSEKLKEADRDIEITEIQFARERKKISSLEKSIAGRRQEINEYSKRSTSKSQKREIQAMTEELWDNQEYLKEWKKDYQRRIKEFKQKKNAYIKNKNLYNSSISKLSRQYQFSIILADGTKKNATLFKISNSLDLALLKLNGYKTPYLKPAERGGQSLGQAVYAIGSPLNLANSVTSGVLSSYREEFVQTNAEIYPGNSGGPLINESGEVMGVNTMKLITQKFEGLGFAIQIEKVLEEFKDYL